MDEAVDCLEEMAALSLLVVLRECRQMGTVLTPEQGMRYLQSRILPHQDRGSLERRTAEIARLVRDAAARSERPGIRTGSEKRELANTWLELAAACTRASVKYEAEQLERRLEQAQATHQEMG